MNFYHKFMTCLFVAVILFVVGLFLFVVVVTVFWLDFVWGGGGVSGHCYTYNVHLSFSWVSWHLPGCYEKDIMTPACPVTPKLWIYHFYHTSEKNDSSKVTTSAICSQNLKYHRRWREDNRGLYLSFGVKTQNVIGDGGGAPWLDLMEMSEEVEACTSPPIVQLSLCQHSQQRGLASINVAQDCQAQVYELWTEAEN